MLAERHMPVDLSFPGLSVLHLDPPVFAVDDFFSALECERMVGAAEATGRMAPSKVGAGNVADAALSAQSSRRTSCTLLLDDEVQAAHSALASAASDLQSRALRLVGAGDGASWGRSGRLPDPGQYCFESLQVAQYQRGQYFMEHEDGFPLALAHDNGFQRHATVLVYLNDCAAGGATRFEHLGLAVQPRRGRALLFFPAFADGRPDDRTLHTAEAAEDVKSVMQQWIARGLAPKSLAVPKGDTRGSSGAAVESGAGIEEVLGARRGKAGKGAKKAGKAGGERSSRGFGAR